MKKPLHHPGLTRVREKLQIYNALAQPGSPRLRVWKKSARELDLMIEARALGIPGNVITQPHDVGELVYRLTAYPHLRDSTICDVVLLRFPDADFTVEQLRGSRRA